MNTEQVMKQVAKIRTSLFTGTHDLKAVEGALNELEKLAKVAADHPEAASPRPAPSASPAPATPPGSQPKRT